jgi:hypothetical protein
MLLDEPLICRKLSIPEDDDVTRRPIQPAAFKAPSLTPTADGIQGNGSLEASASLDRDPHQVVARSGRSRPDFAFPRLYRLAR